MPPPSHSHTPKPPPKPPTQAGLHEAALNHLARYATTQVGLARVLNRRIDRWARASELDSDTLAPRVAEARGGVGAIVARLAASGVVDDANFAAIRARGLHRAGRSRRAVAAHLAARGVAPDLSQAALPDGPEAELDAALVMTRKRRIGPFRTGEVDLAGRNREFGILARAGFTQEVARMALDMDTPEAEARIIALRQS